MRIKRIAGGRCEHLRIRTLTRRGATVMELLTVFAVIGVLIALLLPAVQQAREAARRTQCMSNLRQLGIAAQNYHDQYGMFPAGLGVRNKSALLTLLPYLDQSNLHNKFDWSQFAYDQDNVRIASEGHVSVFSCSSDPMQPYPAATSYVGNCGTGLHANGGFRGVFATHRKMDEYHGGGHTTIADITDGTSHTVAFSEILIGGGSSLPLRSLWELSPGFRFGHDAALLAACDELDTQLQERSITWARGYPWTEGNPPHTMYNHSQVPNRKSCTNNGDVFTSIFTAGSLHPGGVNVCLCDGSARFVNESIGLDVWRSLGTRASGEVISEF